MNDHGAEIPADRLRPALGFKRLRVPKADHYAARPRLQKETWYDFIGANSCCVLHGLGNCNDCGVPSDDLFILYDYLWSRACAAAPAMSERGRLCIICVEARLGRRLNHLDFDPVVPCNDERGASLLMLSRLRDAPPSPHRNVRYDARGHRFEITELKFPLDEREKRRHAAGR